MTEDLDCIHIPTSYTGRKHLSKDPRLHVALLEIPSDFKRVGVVARDGRGGRRSKRGGGGEGLELSTVKIDRTPLVSRENFMTAS